MLSFPYSKGLEFNLKFYRSGGEAPADLSAGEFAVVCHLARQHFGDEALPSALPPELAPPRPAGDV